MSAARTKGGILFTYAIGATFVMSSNDQNQKRVWFHIENIFKVVKWLKRRSAASGKHQLISPTRHIQNPLHIHIMVSKEEVFITSVLSNPVRNIIYDSYCKSPI